MKSTMSKAAKAEAYDALKAKLDTYELAVHDLVNHRFESIGTRLFFKDFEQDGKGSIKVTVSWRGMPIYLVTDESSATAKWPHLYTEQQIDEMGRNSTWERMIHAAKAKLWDARRNKAA